MLEPIHSKTFDQALSYCSAKGGNWHLMTNPEWAAVAEWSRQNGTMPRGNNNYGNDTVNKFESGILAQAGVAKGASGTARTRTGSGPNAWNHDQSPYGIADMNGNLWEWVNGLKIVDGVAKILPDKNGVAPGNVWATAEASWIDTAVNITTGLTSGNKILTLKTGDLWAGIGIPATTDGTGSDTYGKDGFWFTATGERMSLRGGPWADAGHAGVFDLALSSDRSHVSGSVGFRLAFVE
jgi:hypothetical protein